MKENIGEVGMEVETEHDPYICSRFRLLWCLWFTKSVCISWIAELVRSRCKSRNGHGGSSLADPMRQRSAKGGKGMCLVKYAISSTRSTAFISFLLEATFFNSFLLGQTFHPCKRKRRSMTFKSELPGAISHIPIEELNLPEKFVSERSIWSDKAGSLSDR